MASNGTTYVVDRLNQRVEQFNAAGTYVNDTGARGVAVGKFSWPETVAVAPNGMVWVGDTRNGRLQEFNPNLVRSPSRWPSARPAPRWASSTTSKGSTVAANGIVWVADTKNNRIQSYNPTTGVFTAYGTKGSGPGQFSLPGGHRGLGDGHLCCRHEQQPHRGAGPQRQLHRSVHRARSAAGDRACAGWHLWVANTGTSQTDTKGNDIVQLSSTSREIVSFGGPGTGNTQFYLPHSLAVYGSTLFVADTYNNRVQEFTLS